MLIPLIIFLVVIGIVLYFLRSRISGTIYNIIIVVLILAVCLWLLNAFGIFPMPEAFRIGKG